MYNFEEKEDEKIFNVVEDFSVEITVKYINFNYIIPNLGPANEKESGNNAIIQNPSKNQHNRSNPRSINPNQLQHLQKPS